MDPDVPTSAVMAALGGARPVAFTGADASLTILLVGLGVGVGAVVGAATTRLLRRRPDADEGAGRPVRPQRVGLSEDPIVTALGVRDDESVRARRRRRPIGTGLHTPPGDSPPPT